MELKFLLNVLLESHLERRAIELFGMHSNDSRVKPKSLRLPQSIRQRLNRVLVEEDARGESRALDNSL